LAPCKFGEQRGLGQTALLHKLFQEVFSQPLADLIGGERLVRLLIVDPGLDDVAKFGLLQPRDQLVRPLA
jgi:hypothetical protein